MHLLLVSFLGKESVKKMPVSDLNSNTIPHFSSWFRAVCSTYYDCGEVVRCESQSFI